MMQITKHKSKHRFAAQLEAAKNLGLRKSMDTRSRFTARASSCGQLIQARRSLLANGSRGKIYSLSFENAGTINLSRDNI